jgi:hypothetical protein
MPGVPVEAQHTRGHNWWAGRSTSLPIKAGRTLNARHLNHTQFTQLAVTQSVLHDIQLHGWHSYCSWQLQLAVRGSQRPPSDSTPALHTRPKAKLVHCAQPVTDTQNSAALPLATVAEQVAEAHPELPMPGITGPVASSSAQQHMPLVTCTT